MADPKIEDRSDDMERDLHQLEDHIEEAGKKLVARKEAAGIVPDVAGDFEGEQDRGGGDDPKGAKDDAEQGAPGGSQDGPGSDGAGGAGASDEGADDEGTSGADVGSVDEDERADEEYANPT